jgi:ribosome-associated toxin RatA of RatAB toxin-antitoxin module
MKQLTGSAQLDVEASIEACFALLSDVEGYPGWHPDVVREVEVLSHDADGRPERVQATLHVARGPLARDLDLTLAVERQPPGAINLIRLPNEPTDPEEFQVRWRLAPSGPNTRVHLELNANLAVPRIVPLTGVGDGLATGFLAAMAGGVSRSR